MNWLSQIISVSWFGISTIPQRKGAALTAAIGIAGGKAPRYIARYG